MTLHANPVDEKAHNDQRALSAFRATAKKMRPTNTHRCGLWENMLGTVYAMNAAGEVRYFDYNWADAIAFIGLVGDVRKFTYRKYDTPFGGNADAASSCPRTGQKVWFVKDQA